MNKATLCAFPVLIVHCFVMIFKLLYVGCLLDTHIVPVLFCNHLTAQVSNFISSSFQLLPSLLTFRHALSQLILVSFSLLSFFFISFWQVCGTLLAGREDVQLTNFEIDGALHFRLFPILINSAQNLSFNLHFWCCMFH